MNWALAAAFGWLIVANVVAMLPTRDQHRTSAYTLISVGIPILGWVTWANGPVWGIALLFMGCSVLRWPLVFLFRWLRRKAAGAP